MNINAVERLVAPAKGRGRGDANAHGVLVMLWAALDREDMGVVSRCVSLSHRPICCSSHSISAMISRLCHRGVYLIVHIARSTPGSPCTARRACSLAVSLSVATTANVVPRSSSGAVELSTAEDGARPHRRRRASPIITLRTSRLSAISWRT